MSISRLSVNIWRIFFESGELKDDAVVSKMEITAADGKHYQTQFYSLDAIIAVGYRVNSVRANQVQNRLFQSDFDKYLCELPFDGEWE